MNKTGGKNMDPVRQIWILVILGIVCIGLEVGVHFFLHTAIGYTHIFYILLILAAVWYYKKALWVAFALVAATFITSLVVGDFNWATLLRAAMFLLVTYIVAWISEERDRGRLEILAQKEAIEKEHYALVGYLSEITLRIKQPIKILRDNILAIRMEFDGKIPDIEMVKMELSTQLAHAEQILQNFQELNKEMVDEHSEIPNAYKEFLTR
ncbi:MAG: hypothetical protein A4E42_02071 [Methanoregulaceae archaeon PtaU1.Bin222]|nr:MAG: hypothetical protein A4E42_02071 [Methanoregulaceae archaeon PtaU1.Bin222]